MYSNELVCEILDFINNNINKEITINELCNITYYDRTYIMKRFKKELGISINNYINSMRIYNSLSLYRYNNTILNIGFNNGFNSLEYYSEMFKKIVGVSPITFKHYTNRDNCLSNDTINLITDSINNLYLLKNNATIYLSKRKPKTNPIKKIYI